METGAITQYIDVAQVTLYAFWIFFAGLIYYLHQEDKREGYPLESERSRHITVQGWPPIPAPTSYLLGDGTTVHLPNGRTPNQDMLRNAVNAGNFPGAPIEPTGNPLLAGIGPGSWTERSEKPDVTWDHQPRIVPLDAAPEYGVAPEDTDPRGLPVLGADGQVAGIVRDLWLDRSDVMFRYLEVELPSGGRVLTPVTFTRIGARSIRVRALLAAQFADIPKLQNAQTISRREEDQIVGYFGAGTLYATPDRQEPLL